MNPWYRIEDRVDEAELFLYNDIGRDRNGMGISADEMIRELAKVKAKVLHVRINSGGGDVFEGLSIYNALARHPARVVTHIDGIAASIASVIALAGKEVHMAKTGFLMIHNAHASVGGNASDLRTVANTLENVTGSLAGVYVQRTGKSPEMVKAWMDAETWFNAADAKAAGFVDVVTDDMAIAAHFDLSKFSHAPPDVAALVAQTEEKPTEKPEATEEELMEMMAARMRYREMAASIQR